MARLIDEYPYNAASPTGQPGCFKCGTPKRTTGAMARHPNGEYLVDLDIMTDEVRDLEGGTYAYKTAVLCEQCIRELAALVGCADPEESAHLRERVTSLANRVDEQNTTIYDYEQAFESIKKVKVP